MRKYFIFILFLLFSIPVVYPAQEFLGDFQSFSRQEQTLVLHCSNADLKLQIFNDEIVRIQLLREGETPHEHSYAVIQKTWPHSDFTLEETEEALMLETKSLYLIVKKRPCRLEFYTSDGDTLNQDDPNFGTGWDGSRVQSWKKLHPDENFYGLGEKTGNINKKGKAWRMWNTDFPAYDFRKDPLYQSHPFFIGNRNGLCYGIFMDNTYPTEFHFKVGTDRFYTFFAEDGILDYYFIYGPSMKDVLKRYTDLVGKMTLPPKWALGYQQCRYSYYPESEVRTLAETFRNKQFPCDVLYFDIHYMDGYRCFTWDDERFPNPKKMLSDLEKMGFKTVVIIDPGIKVDPGYHVYDQGLDGDHFCKYPDGSLYIGEVWPGQCHFPEYTLPETRAWWGGLYKGLIQDGIDGFWNDMNEPAAWGGQFPLIIQHREEDGQQVGHRKIHNVYGSLMAQGTYEGVLKLNPKKRPFVLTRAGYSGVHRYAAVWTGDNITNWQNLEMSLTMCLGMGLSGIPFTGYDIGGFTGDPTPEMFARWLQLGVVSPLCRNHTAWGTADQEPWVYGDDWEVINRKTLEFRYRMMPYLYDAMRNTTVTGLPVMRAMVLEYPDDPTTFWMDKQFMLGNDLLVAPVITEGARLQRLYLPEGEWYHRSTNDKYTGPAWVNVKAPLDNIPMFAKAGSVIPSQEAEQYVGQKKDQPLILDVYPARHAFQDSLYEDAGEGWGWQKGEYRETGFEFHPAESGFIFEIRTQSGKLAVHERSCQIHVNGADLKRDSFKVYLNQKALSSCSDKKVWIKCTRGYYYNPERQLLSIRFLQDDLPNEIQVR